jgi:hypothetical protein
MVVRQKKAAAQLRGSFFTLKKISICLSFAASVLAIRIYLVASSLLSAVFYLRRKVRMKSNSLYSRLFA